MSILAATILIPLFASRGGTVKQAVRRSIVTTFVFCIFYWLGLVYVYPNLTPSKRTPNVPGRGSSPMMQ